MNVLFLYVEEDVPYRNVLIRYAKEDVWYVEQDVLYTNVLVRYAKELFLYQNVQVQYGNVLIPYTNVHFADFQLVGFKKGIVRTKTRGRQQHFTPSSAS